jgi:LuxR family maltose regulon positive regulatory protein
LDRFCAPLCQAVCNPNEDPDTSQLEGDQFIEWLRKHHLFVIAVDDREIWFRYHHLFQVLLQNQLGNALETGEIADLHNRASHWFAEKGLIDEAIQHALAAGDAVSAAEFVERYRHAEHKAGRWRSVEKWLAMLPEETKRERPGLLLAEAWVAFTYFQLEKIAALVEQAEALSDGQKADSVIWGEVNYFHGQLMYWSGQGEASVRYLEEALTQVGGKEEHVESNIELMLGLARHMIGQGALAIQSLNERIQGTNPSKIYLHTYLSATLAFIHLLSGELHQAFQETQRMQTLAGKAINFNTEAWVAYFFAYVHLQNWDLVDAIPHFEFAAGQQYAMDTEAVIDAKAGLALTQQLLGRETEATQTVNHLYEIIQDLNASQFLPVAQSCQARISLLRGNLKAALELAKSEFKTPLPAELFLWLEVPAITQARVLAAAGTQDGLGKAYSVLKEIRQQCETHFFTNQTIEVAVLQSLVLEKQGRSTEAMGTLEEALALALPGRWIRPFVELGAPMMAMLKRLKARGLPPELGLYLNSILAAFPSASTTSAPGPQPDLINPLTDRELQVLRLLTSSLSAGEIAEELVVSVNTVRMHTKNIYSKLEVHSRIEAVECARKLGLI